MVTVIVKDQNGNGVELDKVMSVTDRPTYVVIHRDDHIDIRVFDKSKYKVVVV
jgi:hypothetical protein